MAPQKLTDMKATFVNAGCQKYFDEAYGWVLFPSIVKAGAMIGAAGGKGSRYVFQIRC